MNYYTSTGSDEKEHKFYAAAYLSCVIIHCFNLASNAKLFRDSGNLIVQLTCAQITLYIHAKSKTRFNVLIVSPQLLKK